MNMEGNLIKWKERSYAEWFLYVVPYIIKMDFAGQTDCIWEIVWRGKDDAHAPVIAEMENGFQWLGSFTQTSKGLMDCVQAFLCEV